MRVGRSAAARMCEVEVTQTRPWRGAAKALAVTAVFCACAILATGLRAETPNTARRDVLAAEVRLADALAHADVDRLGRIWAEDFISTMADGGVTTRDARLKSLRRPPADGAPQLTNRNLNVVVRPYGDMAIALVTSIWTDGVKTLGQPYQATHVWARRKGEWRLVAAHISEVTTGR